MSFLQAVWVKISIVASTILITIGLGATPVSTPIETQATEATSTTLTTEATSTMLAIPLSTQLQATSSDLVIPQTSLTASTSPVIIVISVGPTSTPTTSVQNATSINNSVVNKVMKTLEVHVDQQANNRTTFYVLVKDEEGKELSNEKVVFTAPENKEAQIGTTYNIGRVIADNPDNEVTHAKMHTGARFVYAPEATSTQETVNFSLQDNEKVNVNYILTLP